MACTKERASLINEFAIGRLTPEKTDEVLDHLAGCDECSATLDMVAGILTCKERFGAEIFAAEPSLLAKTSDRVKEVLKGISAPKPLIRVAVPVGVAVVIAVLLLNPFAHQSGEYGRLAQFEAPGYIARSLRGPGMDETVATLFEEGMAAYADGDFSKAIKKLSELTKSHSEFGEALFYLGISYLMENKIAQAIDALQKSAVLLEGYPLGEQSHWYLGMAYLRLKDKDKAIEQFQRVVDLNGAYKVSAERMIEKIEEIRRHEMR
ncbi:MAG: tol-pal system YbgF family protein [bacterium]